MPNIIEQQDLLKGLPDQRLALLMKQPSGDIPPFLVAAEAQRRQAIRQQFAGQGNQESVVDTLTKQMANVPQNIQAPMQTPPNIPPAQQAGIGALQQGMAGGGPVRRFDVGGAVEPMWNIPDYSGVLPRVGDWVGGAARGIYDWATTPYSEMKPSEDQAVPGFDIPSPPDIRIPPKKPEFATTGEPSTYTDLTPKTTSPRDEASGQDDSSDENKAKAEDAAFRKRLKELYGVEEPSNWEEAQKWFAMSAAIMQPGQNLMQGLADAGMIYSQAEGQQAADARDAKRAEAEALLKWDMGVVEDRRAREAAGLKAQTDIATGQMDDLYRQQREISERIRRIDEAVMKGEIDQATADAAKKGEINTLQNIERELSGYKQFIQSQYGFRLLPKVNTQTGQIEYPGT